MIRPFIGLLLLVDAGAVIVSHHGGSGNCGCGNGTRTPDCEGRGAASGGGASRK
jgi:hypothetical protein